MTEEQITEIRNLYAGGMQQKNIASQFGLKVRFVGMIIRGEKGYAHISQSEYRRKCIDCGANTKIAIRCKDCKQLYERRYNTAYQRERRAKLDKALLTDEQIIEIRNLCANGIDQHEIAAQFKRTEGYISKVVRGVHGSHIPLETTRHCKDCGVALSNRAKRCKDCIIKRKAVYNQTRREERRNARRTKNH